MNLLRRCIFRQTELVLDLLELKEVSSGVSAVSQCGTAGGSVGNGAIMYTTLKFAMQQKMCLQFASRTPRM